MTRDDLLAAPFAPGRSTREPAQLALLAELTAHHRARCVPYARVLAALGVPDPAPCVTMADVPYLPVRLFKELELASVPDSRVIRVMNSSGTTGQAPSRVVLDAETAALQARALVAVTSSFLGKQRRPLLIVDSRSVLASPAFGARAAAILGFQLFGRDPLWLLDEASAPDWAAFDAWRLRNPGPPLVFGFTAIVWQWLERVVASGRRLDLSGGLLVHGGGWKRIEGVSRERFRAGLRDAFCLAEVLDYYGMIEQTGSIWMECPAGRLHVPAFGAVIVRDPRTLAPLPHGELGVIEAISALPRSYPGHAILTEDLGSVTGDDDCPCGRFGPTVAIAGRMPRSEPRGCSDTRASA